MRSESIRGEVARIARQAPSRPFILNLEDGDRVTIGHPENIAFDPGGATSDFHVIAGHVRFFGTFDAVTNVAMADSVEEFA